MAETRKSPSDQTAGKSLAGLQALIERAGTGKRGPAPVEKWSPEYQADLDLVIKADGSWYYGGTPIHRKPLVDLFATVLRKDKDGETYLVTPVEQLRIQVEDAAFLIVEMNAREENGEQILTFRTNVGDVIEAGPEHPIRFEIAKENGGLKPYILVRGRLEGLCSRAVMYELVSMGEEFEVNGQSYFGVKSRGVSFPIISSDDLAQLNELR